MSRVSLLNSYDPTFSFEHAVSHRTALGVMSPLYRFSVIPYFIDPMEVTEQPGGPWHLNHQQAHTDAASQLPIALDQRRRGVDLNANLLDYALENPDSRAWWTFVNHLEHYVGSGTVAVTPQPPPAPQWTFPFW